MQKLLMFFKGRYKNFSNSAANSFPPEEIIESVKLYCKKGAPVEF